MLENFLSGLKKAFLPILSEKTISHTTLQKVTKKLHTHLLQVDVALPVADHLLQLVHQTTFNATLKKGETPLQMMLTALQQALTAVMQPPLNTVFLSQNTSRVVLIGPPGVGKTTATVKLALTLQDVYKRPVCVLSLDCQRPSARQQLAILAHKAQVPIILEDDPGAPEQLLKHINISQETVLIIDTPGLSEPNLPTWLMDLFKDPHNLYETLLVLDAMMGQSAFSAITSFQANCPVTGVIVTKVDGDTKGGVLVSATHILKKPIVYFSDDENGTHLLNPFFPARFASRLLDMGDLSSLVERIKHKSKPDKQQFLKKVQDGFNFDVLLLQLRQMHRLGGLQKLAKQLPGVNEMGLPDDGILKWQEALILSMTPKERRFPSLLIASLTRQRRIAKGSGVSIQKLNSLLKQIQHMRKVTKNTGGADLRKQMQKLFAKQ
jgi:signal recognition particle subunit SRP54